MPALVTGTGQHSATKGRGRLVRPMRYRHPGDVIRLIIAGLVVAGALVVTAATHATYAGAGVAAMVPAALMGCLLAGVVQAAVILGAAAALAVTLLNRRFQAFSGGPGLVLVGAVYLAAAALAAAAPSPGGLGAINAALVAGLTGVGMAAGPAVSAVLLYRLATYWLPVAPGWLSWRALQRREYT